MYIFIGSIFFPYVQKDRVNKKRLYWCVAYLPSEASIIEH
jgi:hypothetical protein